MEELWREIWRIPGYLSREEAELLYQCSAQANVLEIGSYCGKSTLCLARQARQVVSIDPHTGDMPYQGLNSLTTFLHNVCHIPAIIPVVEYSYRAVAQIAQYAPYDLVFLDGFGTPQSQEADYMLCQPYLTARATIVLRIGLTYAATWLKLHDLLARQRKVEQVGTLLVGRCVL